MGVLKTEATTQVNHHEFSPRLEKKSPRSHWGGRQCVNDDPGVIV